MSVIALIIFGEITSGKTHIFIVSNVITMCPIPGYVLLSMVIILLMQWLVESSMTSMRPEVPVNQKIAFSSRRWRRHFKSVFLFFCRLNWTQGSSVSVQLLNKLVQLRPISHSAVSVE